MGYCEQDLASLLENMQAPFSEAQVKIRPGFGHITPERVLPNHTGHQGGLPGLCGGLQQGLGVPGGLGFLGYMWSLGLAGHSRTLQGLSRLGFGLEQTIRGTELGENVPPGSPWGALGGHGDIRSAEH